MSSMIGLTCTNPACRYEFDVEPKGAPAAVRCIKCGTAIKTYA